MTCTLAMVLLALGVSARGEGMPLPWPFPWVKERSVNLKYLGPGEPAGQIGEAIFHLHYAHYDSDGTPEDPGPGDLPSLFEGETGTLFLGG